MAELTVLSEAGFSELSHQLAQREAELQIINSVQLGLAEHLDVQAIYDLVGDKIRDIFHAQVVMISTYDKQTETIEHRYAIENGQRIYAPGHHPIRGFQGKSSGIERHPFSHKRHGPLDFSTRSIS